MQSSLATALNYISTTASSAIDKAANAVVTAGNDMSGHDMSGMSGMSGSDMSGHDMSGNNMPGMEMEGDHKMDDMMAEMLSNAKKMHFATSAVVGPILVVFGLIGNILSIIVWTRRGMTSSTGRYLTCLALADSGVLLWFFVVDSLPMMCPEINNSPAYAFFFTYLGYPFFFFFVVVSIWLMVGVTVDRFIMVVLLTKAKEYCNESRANIGVYLITGLCFIINVPHWWSYTVDWERGINGTGPALLQTEWQMGEGGIRYEFWVHCIFLVLVPWFTVFTLNMQIIMRLSKANRKMSSKKTAEAASKSKQSENQVTRLLLIITFAFLFLIGLQCVSQCLYMLMPDGFDKNIIDEAFAVSKLGVVVNSSINFLLYCFSGRRFRNQLFMVLGLKSREYYSHSHSSGTGTGTTGTTSGSSVSGVNSNHI